MDRPNIRRTASDLTPRSPITSTESQSGQQEEKIPRMTNIAPSIFIPLEEDITQPIGPPQDRVEKLERMLAAVEARRHGVTENIIYMAEREMQRIRQEGRDVEAAQGPGPNAGSSVSEGEVDWIMGNIAAPAPPGSDLNIATLPPWPVILPPPGTVPNREAVATELLFTVEQAVNILEGYSKRAEQDRAKYLNMQQKEQKRLDSIGTRPLQHGNGQEMDFEMT